jgi:hypothetical protein
VTQLVILIDTEEDNWAPTRGGLTVENIRRLPAFHGFLRSLGVKPTYFVNHAVCSVEWAADILREIDAGGGVEMGSHLHPWNTPPFDEPLTPRNTMTRNLSPSLQALKLETLTARHSETFGSAPLCYRTGRFGMDAALVPALIRLGYLVDSSVTPWFSWQSYDDGPDHRGAPNSAYRVGPESTSLSQPDPRGPLIELPVSVGFSRNPFEAWDVFHRVVHSRYLRPLRLGGLAVRAKLVQRIVLTPEMGTVQDLLVLSRRLIEQGVEHLHMFLHSSSLEPGLTPFARTADRVNAITRIIADYVEGVHKLTDIRCATVTDAALSCAPQQVSSYTSMSAGRSHQLEASSTMSATGESSGT